MTNRGLFAVLASTSIGIDLVTTVFNDHSVGTIIGAVVLLALSALAIFGALRGYKVAVAGLAVIFVLSVLTSLSDFFPIEALRNIIAPEETIAMKLTNLLTLGILTAALAIFSKGRTV